jgi:SAM-dependent MidA family methyltransferase
MVFSDLRAASDNAALKDIILERIRREGPIPFSVFMELALYHPRHGYYFSQDPSRDYQSSPNVHPIFGAVVASQIAEFWGLMGKPSRFQLLEAGAGDGRLAADILRWLRGHERELYESMEYLLQDRTLVPGNAGDFIEQAGLPGERVRVFAGLEDAGLIEGCILSNELLDAFPVRRVKVKDGRLLELYVEARDGELTEVAREASPEVAAYFEHAGLLPGDGCEAEVNLGAPEWVARAARTLSRGYILTLDYGYPATELYAPWRKQGTLLTFYRHTSDDNPYIRIGRQDITASVDFTALERAGEEHGVRTLGLTSQSEFLAALGIGTALVSPPADQLEAHLGLRRAVMELTDPSRLGRIKVLVQGKDVPETLPTGLQRQ